MKKVKSDLDFVEAEYNWISKHFAQGKLAASN